MSNVAMKFGFHLRRLWYAPIHVHGSALKQVVLAVRQVARLSMLLESLS